ncbi:hypothetical protein AURDEDRAFT_165710 [Auricularia subglabra TFB-10046 SS5]|nr:hypothetical protein AURDEDRAFT_165710 [Auricularia subglabra TFB-10046 SS5]
MSSQRPDIVAAQQVDSEGRVVNPRFRQARVQNCAKHVTGEFRDAAEELVDQYLERLGRLRLSGAAMLSSAKNRATHLVAWLLRQTQTTKDQLDIMTWELIKSEEEVKRVKEELSRVKEELKRVKKDLKRVKDLQRVKKDLAELKHNAAETGGPQGPEIEKRAA